MRETSRARAVRRFTCRRFSRARDRCVGGAKGHTRGTRGKPDGCQGYKKKTRAGPVLVSRGRRRPRHVFIAVVIVIVIIIPSSYCRECRVAISNEGGERAALLVPVMHARQAPSGVFIIAPRSLVPVAEEERVRTTTGWRRRWRHRRRRALDTHTQRRRERDTKRNEKEGQRDGLRRGESSRVKAWARFSI